MNRLIFIIIVACAGCTIAPKPVQVHTVAFSEGKQTAGILGYDATGLFVDQAWITHYDSMLTDYGKKLPASNRVSSGDRTGITQINSDRYHVNFETNTRFAVLKELERDSVP